MLEMYTHLRPMTSDIGASSNGPVPKLMTKVEIVRLITTGVVLSAFCSDDSEASDAPSETPNSSICGSRPPVMMLEPMATVKHSSVTIQVTVHLRSSDKRRGFSGSSSVQVTIFHSLVAALASRSFSAFAAGSEASPASVVVALANCS